MNKRTIILFALCSLLACSLTAQVRAEYWVDNDPGQGKASGVYVSADAASVDIPTSALSYGWHVAGIRVNIGRWSQTYTHRFFKPEPQAPAGVLNGAEYWLDSDPGFGKALSLEVSPEQTNIAMDVLQTDTLSAGWHVLGLRVKYGDQWSQTYTHRFFKPAPAPATTQLTAAEYWIDSDPGLGKALSLEVTPGQTDIAMDVLQTDTLSAGWHVLGIRVRYGDQWSQTYTHRFIRSVKQRVDIHIEAVEAYWDEDTAHPIAIPFTQIGNEAVIDGFDFDTEALTEGSHYLTIHAKANGVWSALYTYEITIPSPTDPTALDAITSSPITLKILRDGQVLILRDGKIYDVHGTELK